MLAASWRNSPYKADERDVIDELTDARERRSARPCSGSSAKVSDREFLKQYNLLGDPALQLAGFDPSAGSTAKGNPAGQPPR